MYGLIGKPLGHSFSANYFNNKFAQEGIEEVYKLFSLDSISELPSLLYNNPTLKGLNVTIPYKEAVIPYLNEISDEAAEVGAVNVIGISRKEDGSISLKGFNSDVIGFRNALIPLIKDKIINKALILGSGGASKAVRYVLKKEGISTLIVSRNPQKCQIGYNEITASLLKEYLLIVNTTPIGMYPHVNEAPDFPFHLLNEHHVCFDLIYNPTETLFMKKAALQGSSVLNGLSMLYGQAEGAWEIWNK